MRNRTTRRAAAVVAVLAGAGAALAGGSPENILLIVNPASAESMYVANYYKNARNIPDSNILYITPTAANGTTGPAPYTVAAGPNGDLAAVDGYLPQANIGRQIDYIVVCNTNAFYADAPGLFTDGCWPVARMSSSSVFATAFQRTTILAGSVPSGTVNHYYSADPNAPLAFASSRTWLNGGQNNTANARRYYLGASLGYTGTNGNTLPEVLAMIDRAIGSDATHPPGRFYFMVTTDPARNVRAGQFPAAANFINTHGGLASVLSAVLPDFTGDNLGIMTGWADPPVNGAAIAPQPGSFCDHLTSWAATFDIGAQTKLSAWIRRGVAGSSGTVEEPCAYTGKFIHANFHSIYFQGLSLGEAYQRSLQFLPVQSLLIGDPMTRPWATLPTVTGNAPAGIVSGTVGFTPTASTTLPGASIGTVSLFIDGSLHSQKPAGQAFSVNTNALPDGYHELRVLAADNTLVVNTGRWLGGFTVNNLGRSATLNLNTASGDLTTLFSADLAGVGSAVAELRLLHNGRVIAASTGSPATLTVRGRNIGAGAGRLQAEALFADGRTARSAPTPITIAYTAGTLSGQAPVAYGFTRKVGRGRPFVVELPGRFDDDPASAAFTILTPPSQGTSVGAATGGYRIMTPTSAVCGPDQFTFRITTPSGVSNTATVTLLYGSGAACEADIDGNAILNVQDFGFYMNTYAAGSLRADMDGSCSLTIQDFGAFLNAYAAGCP